MQKQVCSVAAVADIIQRGSDATEQVSDASGEPEQEAERETVDPRASGLVMMLSTKNMGAMPDQARTQIPACRSRQTRGRLRLLMAWANTPSRTWANLGSDKLMDIPSASTPASTPVKMARPQETPMSWPNRSATSTPVAMPIAVVDAANTAILIGSPFIG